MDLVLTRGREGVQNLNNLADVICASPPTAIKSLTLFPSSSSARMGSALRRRLSLEGAGAWPSISLRGAFTNDVITLGEGLLA